MNQVYRNKLHHHLLLFDPVTIHVNCKKANATLGKAIKITINTYCILSINDDDVEVDDGDVDVDMDILLSKIIIVAAIITENITANAA